MPHTCKALLLHCFDFRFVHDLLHYMKAHGLDRNYDDVGVAGSVKSLVDPKEPSDREFVLRQIETSKRLHGITDIYLANHLDCGAYGGKEAFADEQAEREKHVRDLKAAEKIVRDKWPELTVHSLFASITEKGVRVEELS